MTALPGQLPLTPAVFHILLSLANEEKHGYEIMKEVQRDSGGKVKMGNGTLYGSIKRMLDANLIEEAGDRVDPRGDDTRRRYYRLTDLGRRALQAEMQRYKDTVTLMRRRRLISRFAAGQKP
jgi:DNA-binding PadR family transcriptional regulator